MKRIAVAAALIALLSGCADLGVKPWQRDILAQPEMQLISDPVEAGPG